MGRGTEGSNAAGTTEEGEVMKVYEDTPHAQMLRDLRADGFGYTRLATALGVSKPCIANATTGRHQAGPQLKKRIEALWHIWRHSNAVATVSDERRAQMEMARPAIGLRDASAARHDLSA